MIRGEHHRLLVDVRGPGEWIVGTPEGGRPLHIYRLAPADWLVSEVGCGNEGRGMTVQQALASLAAEIPSPEWWAAASAALERAGEPQGPRG